ncbi:VOC family protein [Novosphingobium piscinae]|uniref:VOC family protein n=1 Tax=Novosphingobium piscinae TaxID=1507448 RepID=A0A7X1FV94_9SPHN|nr:VOC family protein [Novosphingobium piscinae]MBC2667613.1 VOC family protein [Novosphingobium piscinae]
MIRFGHVNIRTDRLEETCRFYEDLLGLTRSIALTAPDPTRNLWLRDASGHACIHVNLRRPDDGTDGSGGPVHHIAFDCPDRAAMADHLAALGLAYTVVETIVPGLVQFNLIDPNGLVVELTFGQPPLPPG